MSTELVTRVGRWVGGRVSTELVKGGWVGE